MPQRKILIVEDDFFLYEELCEFFEEKGFFVLKGNDDAAVCTYEEAVALIRQHKPDIALLDIQIQGDKDGVDIANFIRKHYNIPVVYLTGNPTDENIERIKALDGGNFIHKASKPIDKKQLWASFFLALPKLEANTKEKSLGKFFTGREVEVKREKARQEIIFKNDALEMQTFIKWDDIFLIESHNREHGGNNNVLIHTGNDKTCFLMRGTISKLAEQLPPHFSCFNQATIVNRHKITKRIIGTSLYYLGDYEVKLSKDYKKKNWGKDFPDFD